MVVGNCLKDSALSLAETLTTFQVVTESLSLLHLTPFWLLLASGPYCWFSWCLFSVEWCFSVSSAGWRDPKMIPQDAPWLFLLLETWIPFMVSWHTLLNFSVKPWEAILCKVNQWTWNNTWLIVDPKACIEKSLSEKTSEKGKAQKKEDLSQGTDSELSMG